MNEVKTIDGNQIQYGNDMIPVITKINEKLINKKIPVTIEPEYKMEVEIKKNGRVYYFYNDKAELISEKPSKKVEKYWGHMTTIIDHNNISVKRILMTKGSQSSMEYHIEKKESYLIEEGRLKIGFRIGRAQNKSVIMNKGEVITIPIGLMHMRMAQKDTMIVEISTPDNDADSHLVEDGKKYNFVEDKN